MPAPLLSIASSEEWTEQADAVVIGGGIIGVCTAYFLAREGMKVALLEKGRIGAEQSSRNWGWCRQQNRDARELPLATKSLDLWEEIAKDIDQDLGFRRCGLLYLSDNEAELDSWSRWRDFAKGEGVITHMLTSQEANSRGKATNKPWQGGVFSPSDGIADPAKAAPLIAQGASEKYNCHIHQFCAARGVETEAGKVTGVITEKGVIKTNQVIMAGGAWASSFCKQLGIRFPQSAVRSSILSVMPGAMSIPDAMHTSQISVTKRGDGGYTLAISGTANVDVTPQQMRFATHFLPMFAKRWKVLSPGDLQGWLSGHETRSSWSMDQPTPMEKNRILDPRPSKKLIHETLRRARQMLPELGSIPMQASWAGYIDSTPDGVPVIDQSSNIQGFTLAAGFSGHGFGIGPGVGRLISELIVGKETFVNHQQYQLNRLNKSAWGKVSEF
ncbi:NAD(P)/FAD-dependent oxidoreductase [Marinomonas mediterranea]|jgi:Glycine/D-amino acid oxidases (deaminating)|uniref:FAD dependent oxidoreductase n=1 Tax=Marinomonas mediterranea (strain ATCC 700492 / JCM 21426 / NBRC 103028 / MMB-1) TaxID=717774 RepID=F2JV34_MARM1|nr:FAD-binding oxidoreductase [Marinomonas mediterranea]ADZ91688.1 FAD dependent oxidoreductase [Marinomonas mediterranea MMB-1]WCN17784.1 FAD-dependent oxidoreductase [Marinomonas mediterranea MMB-1]